MELEKCCDAPVLQWKQTRVSDRFTDMYLCVTCGHIHRMESWPVPVEFPTEERCVNCAGRMVSTGVTKGGRAQNLHCDKCGLTPEKSQELHESLRTLHPDNEYLPGALLAAEVGRQVLALKLSSAAVRWGPPGERVLARTLRLESLQALGLLDRALDEAYEWVKKDNRAEIWRVLGDLEADAGNLPASAAALKRVCELDATPESFVDLAELLLEMKDTRGAVHWAGRAARVPELENRVLFVLAEAAEDLYEAGDLVEALAAMAPAQPFKETYFPFAWLQARIAARQLDEAEAVRWLEVCLTLDPAHAGAREALERLRPPPKRRGWLW